MTRWKKGMQAVLLSAALALALAAPAYASGAPDLERTGTVTLTASDEADHLEDLAESAVAVRVYKAADVDEGGVFTPTEAFAALAENEQWNGGVLTGSTRVQDLLDAALAVIYPAEEGTGDHAGEPAPEEEAELLPDEELETAAVGGELELGVGLYVLLPQTVETERWVYTFSPMLLAVPSVADGVWQYELPVTMKQEREPRLTELVIEKALTAYNASLGPTTFVFDVEAELDGESVYSNVVSLTFAGPGTQSVRVEGIPVGAHVTVTEEYTGASYTPADGRVRVEIDELPLPEGGDAARAAFTNTYDDRLVPDASVVNRFVFNGTGWSWTNQSEEG